MQFVFRFAFAMVVCSATVGYAQQPKLTLTEQLQQESPERLVARARQSGDIVRGAILFHQGSLNCAKCHQPAAEKDRLAPDLSRLEKEVTDASLVESILDPSKAISKGYETLNILTGNGRVISGLVVSQDDDLVVLRDGQDIDKLHRIPQANIDQTNPSKVSIMPSGLADQLTGRQQFLDLLRYVIDIKERGPANTAEMQASAPRRKLTAEIEGLVLMQEHHCSACHESSFIDSLPAAHQGPNLKWSAQRLRPQYLARFIADPHQTKPGTRMPSLLGQIDEAERTESAKAIVHFLLSIAPDRLPDEAQEVDHDSIESGRSLFHSVGCVACHAPRDEKAVEQPLEDSVPMGELRTKYSSQALTAFLENPHAARPSGRMPNMQLTHREASLLSSYLLQNDEMLTAVLEDPWPVDAKLSDKGKQLFTKLNCAECHSGIIDSNTTSEGFTKLANLDTSKGCLSGALGNWPDFALTELDTKNIRAGLDRGLNGLDPQQTIDFTLTSFGCTVCHSRDNLGGVSQQRRIHFQTTNLNLGEQGRIPPTLTGVGAKLNPKWMRDVLVNGRSIRPYMKTRMPKYGEHNIGHLVDLFQATDKLPETQFAEVHDQKETRNLGLKIVGNQGLNCAACHTYQYKLSDTMPAVDLTEMVQRLKKDWFYQYMLAPQKFSPNTVMPSYWPGGVALRRDIDGSPEDQIEAIWQYLIDGRQARAPAGVIREPLEIVVTDEARMLRRKYAEIGKRGIGVGYPGGVNLAYDAQQMRLASIWRGKFVDPAAVWYGQGSGNVRAMGTIIPLPKGPELFSGEQPEITDNSRPTTHQFKGYTLDDKRRPTLRYEFGEVAVEDYFREYPDDATNKVQLRRSVTFTSAEKSELLRFRLANGDGIESNSNDRYRIGKGLTIRVASGQKAELMDAGLLFVPLQLDGKRPEELVLEYLWE
ncbi:c-type cytochrome [Planctomycetes bacterium K23_9]|uniref:Cytochrome c n=1 Tax=Stieleria marina TaxID=1930275 RepID=A0A517NM83_9BACT|nr:Cytochrome c [Planctomycetes bacterium K23_9]